MAGRATAYTGAVTTAPNHLASMVRQAADHRAPLLASGATTSVRAFVGSKEGFNGVDIDLHGPAAIVNLYEHTHADSLLVAEPEEVAAPLLKALAPLGATSVYLKPFVKDRSHLGGNFPDIATDPTPSAGVELPEAITVLEHSRPHIIRPADGLSAGLFLDQRSSRQWIHTTSKQWGRALPDGQPLRVLNLFAYTCAFGVAAATAGAHTTNVDVSSRFLGWGKENYLANGLDVDKHRFVRAGAMEYLADARRKGWKFDIAILDPPSFGSADKKRKIAPWRAVEGFPALVTAASQVLSNQGLLLASTNNRDLAAPTVLPTLVEEALGKRFADHIPLPPMPPDFMGELGRFARSAVALRPHKR